MPASPLRRAARWARDNADPLGYQDTAPALDALADRAERGELDTSTLPADAGWSDAVEWAEARGVDAWAPCPRVPECIP